MLRVTFYTSGSLATRALYTRMPWHTVDDELLVCSLNVIRAEMQLKSMHSEADCGWQRTPSISHGLARFGLYQP
jgi:hypothetical protein